MTKRILAGMPKKEIFKKRKVAIICADKIIHIADSVKACSKIFRKGERIIGNILNSGETIGEYKIRYATEHDSIDEDLLSSKEIGLLRERIKDWENTRRNVAKIINAKKNIKTKLSPIKAAVLKQATNRQELLESIWRQKLVREPTNKEKIIFAALVTLPYTEFYIHILQKHIEARGYIFSEESIKKVLRLLSPFVRKKENKSKSAQLQVETYYLLNQDVAVIRHSLRSSIMQTDFIPQSEFQHIIDKIQKKYGVDVIGCEFNIYLAE